MKYCKSNNPHSPTKPAGGFYVEMLWISIIFTAFVACRKDDDTQETYPNEDINAYLVGAYHFRGTMEILNQEIKL